MKQLVLIALLLSAVSCAGLRKVSTVPCVTAKEYGCTEFGFCGPRAGTFDVGASGFIYFTADTEHPWKDWRSPDPPPRVCEK
jgi:hypothetical protein